jgi:hypothetical protein
VHLICPLNKRDRIKFQKGLSEIFLDSPFFYGYGLKNNEIIASFRRHRHGSFHHRQSLHYSWYGMTPWKRIGRKKRVMKNRMTVLLKQKAIAG